MAGRSSSTIRLVPDAPRADDAPAERARACLAAGRAAAADCRWDAARDAFAAALALAPLPEAHDGLADALTYLGDGAAGLAHRQDAYRLYRQRGDAQAAARAATRLGAEYADLWGQAAVGHGWLRRAETLLEGAPPSPELAWLRVWQSHVALVVDGDLAAAQRLAAEGAELAGRLGLPAVQMLAQAQRGMALVQAGEPAAGFALLDEIAAAACSGELDDIDATGISACYVLHACEHVLDFERVFQWVRRTETYLLARNLTATLTFCREHLCRVRVWRGEWERAEQELERLVRDFAPISPAYAAIAQLELADLRCRQGRFAEALELLDADGSLPAAHLVRGQIALDEGRPAQAAELAERYLRRLGAGERLRRAGGLALLARARAHGGDLAEARRVLAEIERLAAAADTVGMRAVVAAVGGEIALAAGDGCAARRAFEDASDLYAASGAPFEAACSRAGLARCLAAAGRAEEAAVEARAAAERLRALGAGSRADRLERQLGGAPAPAGEPAGPLAGLSERELEVLAEIAGGRSNDEIAHRLHLSVHTVKRHVANLLAKLDLPSRTAAASLAVRCGVEPRR